MRAPYAVIAFLLAGVPSAMYGETLSPPPSPSVEDAVVEAANPATPEAGNEDAGARERAKVFFEQGIEHYRNARYAEALENFKAALDAYDSPVFIFNLARTCDHLGDVPCALRHYRSYQRRAPQAKDLAEVVPRIQALQAELVSRGLQQITVQSKPSGAALDVDGVGRGKTPWTGELAPGAHAAKLTLAGQDELRVDLDVPAASASEVTLIMSPRVAAPPLIVATTPPPAPREPEPARRRVGVWTYAAFGAGAAALGGALVFELLSRAREEDVRMLAVQRDRVAAYDDMGNYQTTARVLAGVGVGLAAVATTLLVLDLRRPAPRQDALTFWVAPRGSGLAWRGSW